MLVKDLFDKVDIKLISGDTDNQVTGICFDNRSIKDGDAFVCVKGVFFDTHDVIEEIAEKKPSIIVVSNEWAEEHTDIINAIDANIVSVADTREAKAAVSSSFYGDPSHEMTVIGITGSKGKTTTAHMIASMIENSGHKVGMVGTTGGHIGNKDYHFGTTTPDSDKLQEFLRIMVDEGCEYAVVETSSQGLKMHRVDFVDFDYGVFLNIDKGDHVSPTEHPSFDDYLMCKSLLMKMTKFSVINADDDHAGCMIKEASKYVTFGERSKGNDYVISDKYEKIVCGKPCVGFHVSGEVNEDFLIGLPGVFNVVNASAAVAVADNLDLPMTVVKETLSRIKIIGRLDMIYRSPELSVCIDYAHNGVSTVNLLKALRAYEPKRIVCVFGCGGDRDIDRRPEMGEAAGQLADLSIITSEHNRFEKFAEILKGIKQGIDKTGGEYIVIEDRKEAIRKAIVESEPGDLVAVIGIGNDGFQHDHGKDIPHDDISYSKEMIDLWLSKRK